MNKKTLWFLVVLVVAVGGIYYFDTKSVGTVDLVGIWQSEEDPNFKREFRADGTVIDTYEGVPEVAEVGTWSTYTREIDETTILEIEFTKDSVEMEFVILKNTTGDLQLTYTARGNTQYFMKLE